MHRCVRLDDQGLSAFERWLSAALAQPAFVEQARPPTEPGTVTVARALALMVLCLRRGRAAIADGGEQAGQDRGRGTELPEQ
jgi:hypothetical protein